MAECSFARCQQERRAIRKELQRWTKNMVYILGLERVAEELMGRRKWKLYQEGMLPREDAPPADVPDPPALKIKTIEQINARDHDHDRDRDRDRDRARDQGQEQERSRPETILESLIKRPPAPPKLDTEEPSDWKPPDKCYFCVDGEKGDTAAGPTSPQSGSDSSSVSGARSPAAAPPLLQHLLQLQTQSPHAIAQFQQMMATLAALGSGLVPPPALSQAWLMQRLLHAQQPATAAAAHHRLVSETSEKTDGSSALEQPLDLSAKPAPTATPPPAASAVPVAGPAAVHDAKLADNTRLKRSIVESTSVGAGGALGSIGAVAGGGAGAARRAYSDDELASALRDIQTGKLGTRRAALLYGIPRSTLRNKVYKLAAEPGHESEGDSDPERDTPPSVILKIPTFPPPDDKPASPAPPSTHTTHPAHSGQPRHAAHHTHSGHPAPLLLPPSVFADPPAPQHLFTSLSDVIAKSISQKFQQPLDRVQPELPFLRAPDRHVSVIKTPPDATRGYAAVGPVQPTGTAASSGSRGAPNNGQSAASAAGGKGTRPKRGKYRNYDRDSLVEAVKAVQRGEMSVHRAGSYYGVPHSTLEYKVKERHLMRPRKREPKPPLDPKPAPKPPPPKPMAKPFSNGLGANGPDPTVPYAAYPFWASGFAPPAPSAPDLYASHMMRRLRDEAPPSRTPPALPTHPPPSANGSFLEGIIRSSLERPGVAGTSGAANAGGAAGAALLQRLTAVAAEEPAARRPRLDTSDRQLAADMRDTVQRLRQDKLRPRNGTPTPPASSTPAPSVLSPESPPALSPGPAPPDRA